MKKTLLIVALTLVVVAGCDVTDPDGKTQRVAQDVNDAAVIANNIIGVTPVPSPLKETLLSVVAIIGAAAGAVQTLRKKKTETVLTQVVRGVDDAIKSGAIVKSKEFAAAMNGSQDSVTRAVVTKIQAKS